MNVFGWDYPAGAEHDPRAPWNQREPEDCRECGGAGDIFVLGCRSKCERCDGTGHEQSDKESREDYEADLERDDV